LGGLGVAGFFVISGFLVTQSGARLSMPRYLWHRSLRIFPAFLVCLLVTAFVFAPALWLYEYGGMRGFFQTDGGPVGYVTSNALLGMNQWSVSGLPLDVPYNQIAGQPVFDGPLWTLEYEFACYLLVAVLAVIGLRRFGAWVVPALLAVAWIAITLMHPTGGAGDYEFVGPVPLVGGWINPFYLVQFVFLFLLGATCAVHRHRIPASDALAFICALVTVATILSEGYRVVGYATLAYIVLWMGIRLPDMTRHVGARWDISYGIYIYAFVIQQTLAEIGVRDLGLHLLLTFLFTIPLAALSWRIVERPALDWKAYTPGLRQTSLPLLHPIPAHPIDRADLVPDAEARSIGLDGRPAPVETEVVHDDVTTRGELGIQTLEGHSR